MKYFRCILSSIIAIFLCMSAFTGTATAVENNSPPIDVTTCQTNPIELTDEQQDTLNKIVSVGTHFGSARVFAHFGLRPSPWR